MQNNNDEFSQKMVKPHFDQWKNLCNKNKSVPLFMVGLNLNQGGLSIYADKCYSRDQIATAMREILNFWESQGLKRSESIIIPM